MTARTRQNALFAAEQWTRIYEAMSNVDFRAADMDTYRTALMEYVRANYPEDFNDWIGSSEFVIKVDILAWLSQNIAWRVDMNARENYLATAERRDSLLRLAQNIAYAASRVRPASGELRIRQIRTTERLFDADDEQIAGPVTWNDRSDLDWFDKWVTVLNAALNRRNPFGRPIKRFASSSAQVSLYRLSSLAPPSGSYPVSATVAGKSIPFELVNVDLDPSDGTLSELAPDPLNAFHIVHRTDGLGTTSTGTGFFTPVRQGSTGFQDELFSSAISSRAIDVDVDNLNEEDVWVCEVNADGTVVEQWKRADSSFGVGASFNASSDQKVFEVLTRDRDRITIRFGDGKFGTMPVGNFRIWYRSSSADARPVRASDIRDRSVSIPYVAQDGSRQTLTMILTLEKDMTDAAPTESNADIRTRANKVFYSQNRMATAEDANGIVLKDTSILKVKAINRTYSGHGASIPLREPTGTYSNVRLVGEDGRVYKKWRTGETVVTADPIELPPEELVTVTVQNLLDEPDKATLYHNEYPELPVNEYTWWSEDSLVNDRSRGRLFRDPSEPFATPLGDDADDDDVLELIGALSILRFTDSRGQVARIERVAGNGTAENGIVLKDFVSDDARLFAVFPALRPTLTAEEKAAAIDKITLKRSFGLRWEQSTVSWKIIDAEDIDQTGDFSLEHQGDVTKAGLDASWIVRLQYNPVTGDTDTWTIYDRGLKIVFESDRDVDFYYADADPIVDSRTGRALRDRIVVTADNETRDSPSRRGYAPSFGIDPRTGVLEIVGDGTTTEFELGAEGLNASHLFLTRAGIQMPRTQWEMIDSPDIDRVRFTTAPADGEVIAAKYDPITAYHEFKVKTALGDDTNVAYELGSVGSTCDNVWAFVDGKLQRPGQDFSVARSITMDRITFMVPPGNTKEVQVNSLHGAGSAFAHIAWTGTGSQSQFATLAASELVWVFVAGVYMHPSQWTLSKADPSNYSVVLAAPAASGAKVDIRVGLFPELATINELEVLTTTTTDNISLLSIVGDPDTDAASRVLVWVNGLMKNWSYEDGFAFFDTVLASGTRIHATFFDTVAAPTSGLASAIVGAFPTPTNYLPDPMTWWVAEKLYHDDGYTNENGLVVTNVDEDRGGDQDNPFLFKDFVLDGGNRDLVMWRKIEVYGAEVWDPISEVTSPKGTFESTRYSYEVGDEFEPNRSADDVHYKAGTWLIADGDTGLWAEAEDQDAFTTAIGRPGIRFMWEHFSSENGLIDPSPANIIDMFVLTRGYDTAYREWIETDGAAADEPEPETPDQLRDAYGKANADKKMMSDALVWRPARYKPLFGDRAQEELRCKLVVVKVPGSTVPDSDLKLRVLSVIDTFFAVDKWDFGETFYFTELAAHVHKQLSGVVQTIVPVPRTGAGNFGRTFQVRAEPDELFVSVADPDDVEIATSLVDSNLKIT